MTAYRVVLPIELLDQVEEFFTDRGAHGVEGTGLIACAKTDHGRWLARRFATPDQRAHRNGGGCWVEVTDTGKRELAAALGPDERYLIRVHSHPADAFHSPTDDRNPALTFLGALSIVVPYYGLGLRLGLDACAVLRLTAAGWQPIDEDRDQWVRVGTSWEEPC